VRRYRMAGGLGAIVVAATVAVLVATRLAARTGPLIATIPTTSFPSLTLAGDGRAVLVDETGTRARVLDTVAGQVIGTLLLGAGMSLPLTPVAVDARLHRAFMYAFSPARFVPRRAAAAAIMAVDLRTGHVLRSVTGILPPALVSNDAYLAADARRHRLFALVVRYPAVSVLTFDTLQLRLLRAVTLGPRQERAGSWGTDGAPLAVDEATGRVFVGRVDEEAVAVLDAASGRLRRTVALGPAPSGAGVGVQVACPLVDPGLARVYIPNPAANTFTTLDALTGNIVRTVQLTVKPGRPVVDAAARRVFLPYQFRHGFAVFDARSGRLLWTRAGGPDPASSPIALDARRHRLFLADYMAGTVGVVDTRTRRLSRTVGVGGEPGGLALDQPQGRVLVTTAGPCCIGASPTGHGALTVLDGGSGRIVRTVALGWTPAQTLIDERAGRVLVVNAQGGTVPEPDPWAWVPQLLRQRLPFLPRPRVRTLRGSVMVFDHAGLQ